MTDLISAAGLKKLEEEYHQLWRVERPKVVQGVSDAAAEGDRSENAEYIYGKKRLREIDRKLKHLGSRLKVLRVASPPANPVLVTFGCWVTYEDEDGNPTRKANCDVDMAFYMMQNGHSFDRAVVLSGDGDFLPVLKHLRKSGKDVYVLARSKRTAKEIKQFAASEFRDFEYLRELLKRNDEEEV